MKRRYLRPIVPALLTLSAVSAIADDTALLNEARAVATSIPPKLIAVLKDEIAHGGPEGAIAVCRDKAPQMAKAASAQSGWSIRRVSLKNRNPKAVPDAWERAVLEDFERRAATGEAPETLEAGEVVVDAGKKSYRYMKALPTQTLCLACHGSDVEISPAVRTKLQALYPDDKATGYALGEIRGAMTIRRPL
ncbi:DUF3365 domain-containing protein [Azoarcus sp. L1K30]|uniref:Tll0287-like domain-containing protein n=1 Tax=Azoarcus sp. L1K30 TaxID=2820277 RepID=UPI001B82AE1E|nr:DUF3365 domain-containing protein [Azoarcus sp. L1K30]MBR0566975.1 DUF3365 domain-containing protein [Azoarcus sp. L1K30]